MIKQFACVIVITLALSCVANAQAKPSPGPTANTGVLNVMNYGAKCDGSTDDTHAIQAVITQARNSKYGNTILVPGNAPCVVTQLDFTNIEHRLRIVGETSFGGLQASILCRESTSNNKVCIDFSGAGHLSVENLRFDGGTSLTDAPRVVVLMGKTVGPSPSIGNGSETSWHKVSVLGYGDYEVYDYGSEAFGCTDCYLANLSPTGNTGVAVLVLSGNNTAGIVSPFAKLRPAPVSMTGVHFSGGATSFGVQGSAVGILFDPSRAAIADIGFADGYAHVSGPAFISEEPSAAGMIQGLRITGWRTEAYTPTTVFAAFSNVVQEVYIDAGYANAGPTVPPLQFNRKTPSALATADITLRPNDSPSTYPSVVVFCGAETVGVTIHDFVARGGVPQTNDCPGATEIFHGTYNGCSGVASLSGGRARVANGCIVGTRPIICTDNSSTSGASCSAVPTRGGLALYGSGSDKVSWVQQ